MNRPVRVAIIGAGFAGLGCAVALASRGARVTVLEARRGGGGRASSFLREESGEVIDNGQHLFMACYHATTDFLRKIGTSDLMHYQKDLTIVYLEDGRRTTLKCPALPAPWHLVAGLVSMRGLGAADRLALLRAAPELRRLRRPEDARQLAGLTVTGWLDRMGQTPRMRDLLWHPLAIATLNEEPDVAPASLLARVIVEGFGRRQDSVLGWPIVGLSDLYVNATSRYLAQHGGQLRFNTRVAGLHTQADRVLSIETHGGERIDADTIVSAVPPHELSRLGVPVPGLEKFVSSPILSVNFWLDRPVSEVADFDFAGLVGRGVHWLFNKERMLQGKAGHLAAVISAARDLVERDNDDLAAMAWEDIRACLPAADKAKVVRSMVVRERTATFSATIETEPLRPGPRSGLQNLLLAGDWTAQELPATIEAAVRSGYRCADIILPPAEASSGA